MNCGDREKKKIIASIQDMYVIYKYYNAKTIKGASETSDL